MYIAWNLIEGGNLSKHILNIFLSKYGGNPYGEYIMINCPTHEDKNPSCKVYVGIDGIILAHCFSGCSQEVLISKFKEDGMWLNKQPLSLYQLANDGSSTSLNSVSLTTRLIGAAVPIESYTASLGNCYISSRGLDPNNASGVLFNSEVYCKEIKEKRPCVLFVFYNQKGNIQAVQRIYLDNDGQKAVLEHPKKFSSSVTGAFAPFGRVTPTVILAEGCETALGLFQSTGLQTFASGGCENMKNFIPPSYAKKVVIAADKDLNSRGQQAAFVTQQALRARGVDAIVAITEQNIPEGKSNIDFLDILNSFGKEEVKRQIDNALNSSELENKLVRTKQGLPHKCVENLILVFSHHIGWKNKIALNAFSGVIEWKNEPPWNEIDRPAEIACNKHWTDTDNTRTVAWFQRMYGFEPSDNTVQNAIYVIAERNAFHPVKEYLTSIKWDGVERLIRFSDLYLGISPSEFAKAAIRKFLISAVARIMQPGCKADHALILEGKQGICKSSAISALFGEDWFNDTPTEFGSKDFYLSLRGNWCIELAELSAVRKTEVNRIKAVLSAKEDSFRPPYGRNCIKIPRQNVFIGTVNDDAYLPDDTGNRRFWPVPVKKVEIEALKKDRDLLWTEAYQCFKNGENWWFSPEDEARLCIPEQEERTQSDPWEEIISAYIISNPEETSFSMQDILSTCLGLYPDKIDKASQSRAGKILKKLGWVRQRTSINGERNYRYVKIKENCSGYSSTPPVPPESEF